MEGRVSLPNLANLSEPCDLVSCKGAEGGATRGLYYSESKDEVVAPRSLAQIINTPCDRDMV